MVLLQNNQSFYSINHTFNYLIMSISQNPLFGAMSKSMANFSTYTRDGQNIIRSKAFRPKDAKTKAQLLHRAGFKLISNEFQLFGSIPSLGFVERKKNLTAYNAFMAANLSVAIDKTGDVPVINYSKLIVSKGSLPIISVIDCVVEANVITMRFNTNLWLPKVSDTDDVALLIVFNDGGIHLERHKRGKEAQSSIQYSDTDNLANDLRCCYMFALSADGKKSSNSVYVEISGQ